LWLLRVYFRADDTPLSATKCSSNDKPAFADLRSMGCFGVKIISAYVFHYYRFFLEKTAQKAGLIGLRF
jgi:hypothetical protein